MSIAGFLRQLFDTGRVTAAEGQDVAAAERQEVDELLRKVDPVHRRQLPAGLPPLDLEAARYGAMTLYRACQLLVYRNFDAAAVQGAIAIPPSRPNPAEHASVDLVLHFLPDVVRLSRAAAPQDVLVTRLLELSRHWPLSSVGIAGVGQVDIDPLIRDATVWRVYIDRVIAKGDASRLADERVCEAVRESVGAFPHLAGPLAAIVSRESR